MKNVRKSKIIAIGREVSILIVSIFYEKIMEEAVVKKMQDIGFSFEEIASVQNGIADIEKWNFVNETEFYSFLEKNIFMKKTENV